MRILPLLLTLFTASAIAQAADKPPAPRVHRICPVPADEDWKPQEQFVWQRVCVGEEANFNTEPGYGGDLDPKAPAGLPESRVLSPTFLETILLSDKYRHALTRSGVRITGARFTERVDLRNAELSHELWLDRSLFEKGADLRGLRSSRPITFSGSKIIGLLDMAGLDVHADLYLNDKAEIGAMHLGFAHIGGAMDLTGASFAEDADMTGTQIHQGLLIEDAKFAGLNLTAAHPNWLLLGRSRVAGLLNMNQLQVDSNLVMLQDEFTSVLIGAAHVQGNMVLTNSKVTADLTMLGLRVDGNLMNFTDTFNTVNVTNAEVRGDLAFIGSSVTGNFSLTNIHVDQSLLMNSISEKDLGASLPESLRGSLETMGRNTPPIRLRFSRRGLPRWTLRTLPYARYL